MRVLITGGTGLLGWQLLQRRPDDWDTVAALHRNQDLPFSRRRLRTVVLDITNRGQVEALLKEVRPEVIIHTASIGNLDYASSHPEETWRVNVEGTRYLLEFSGPDDPVFVFTSTLYVFDGTSPPYDEDAPTHPINHYSQTKTEAEKLVLAMSSRPVVLRLMTMYGCHSPHQRMNWVTWLISELQKNRVVPVVEDVVNNFLWVGDARDAVLAALKKNHQGIFHVGGSEPATRYEFSMRVAEVFGFERQLLTPVSSDYFSGLVPRPKNTCCSIRKLQEVLGVVPLNLEDGLRTMKDGVAYASSRGRQALPWAAAGPALFS